MKFASASKSCCGFTLIELLIVVVILSSLVAVVAPQFSSTGDSSKGSALAYNTKMVQSAIDRYKVDNGMYPSVSSYGSTCAGIDRNLYDQSTPFSFLNNRLTLYSNGQGGVCLTKKDAFQNGPYLLKPIPENPLTGFAAVKVIPSVWGQNESSKAFGWVYDQNTGEFVPFDE